MRLLVQYKMRNSVHSTICTLPTVTLRDFVDQQTRMCSPLKGEVLQGCLSNISELCSDTDWRIKYGSPEAQTVAFFSCSDQYPVYRLIHLERYDYVCCQVGKMIK